MDKKPYVLHIAGKRYVIRSDAEESYVQALAGFVDEQIREVENSSRPAAAHSMAVLAALNIADTLFQERKQGRQLKRQVRDETDALLDFLDQEVAKYAKQN